MKNNKEPEYPTLYDPRSKTGKYYPFDKKYKKKMKKWKKWYNNKTNINCIK